jgi:DNA-binding LacI/PurR family transcriptional regulator
MVDSVSEDHYAGMDQILEYWKQEGFSKIGYVSHEIKDESVSKMRYDAFKQALKWQKLKGNPRWEVFIPHNNITEIEEYRILERKLSDCIAASKKSPPEVFVCFNDQIAYNTQSILEELGASNIRVSGWDKNPFMKHLITKAFPTIKTNLQILAFETMKMMLSRIVHPLGPTKNIIVQSSFDQFTPFS